MSGKVVWVLVADGASARLLRADSASRRLELLREAAHAASRARVSDLTADRLEEGFRKALGELAHLAGADRAAILLFDETERVLMPRFSWSLQGLQTLTSEPVSFDVDNPVRIAIERDGIVVVDDVRAMPDSVADTRARILATGLGSFVDVRLVTAGKLIGLLGFGSAEFGKHWGAPLTRLLEVSAQMFANAIDRVRADEAMRRHREELAHVLRVGTMGQLASGIAHELNQPLSAIISYAQGCRRRIASGEGAGAFHEERFIQRRERLLRRVGTRPTDARGVAVGGVEVLEHRERNRAIAEGVQCSAVTVGALRFRPDFRSVARRRLEEKLRRRRKDARSAEFQIDDA